MHCLPKITLYEVRSKEKVLPYSWEDKDPITSQIFLSETFLSAVGARGCWISSHTSVKSVSVLRASIANILQQISDTAVFMQRIIRVHTDGLQRQLVNLDFI